MIRKHIPVLALILSLGAFAVFTAIPVRASGVVGNGTPSSCTEAALNTALAGGGSVTFNCGGPKTILLLNVKTIAAGRSSPMARPRSRTALFAATPAAAPGRSSPISGMPM